jgi:hypothetical protein
MCRFLRITVVSVGLLLCLAPLGQAAPRLGWSPVFLEFPVTEHTLSFQIYNTGDGVLEWSVSPPAEWLVITPTFGVGDGEVIVTVDRTGLDDGVYNEIIWIDSNGGAGFVVVYMTSATGPLLSVSPMELKFSPAVTTQTFDIENLGFGTLEWSLAAHEPWIDIAPPLSGSGDATSTINVIPQLVPQGGVHIGHVNVASNGGDEQVEIRFTRPGPPPETGGIIGLFAEPNALTCNLLDTAPGLLSVYVVHTTPWGAGASEFSAPIPDCMIGATWIADELVFPATIGDSQSGVAIAYGGCMTGPAHILTIMLQTAGTSEICCLYPVVASPNPPSGRIQVATCDHELAFGSGNVAVANPDASCTCGLVAVEQTTWGRVKAMFAPESTTR